MISVLLGLLYLLNTISDLMSRSRYNLRLERLEMLYNHFYEEDDDYEDEEDEQEDEDLIDTMLLQHLIAIESELAELRHKIKVLEDEKATNRRIGR